MMIRRVLKAQRATNKYHNPLLLQKTALIAPITAKTNLHLRRLFSQKPEFSYKESAQRLNLDEILNNEEPLKAQYLEILKRVVGETNFQKLKEEKEFDLPLWPDAEREYSFVKSNLNLRSVALLFPFVFLLVIGIVVQETVQMIEELEKARKGKGKGERSIPHCSLNLYVYYLWTDKIFGTDFCLQYKKIADEAGIQKVPDSELLTVRRFIITLQQFLLFFSNFSSLTNFLEFEATRI